MANIDFHASFSKKNIQTNASRSDNLPEIHGARASTFWLRARRSSLISAGIALSVLAGPPAYAQSLHDFAILAGSTITNTGTTTISGSIGVSPGTAITGVGPGADQFIQTNGTIHVDDGVATQAQSDLTSSYNVLMGLPSTALSGDLGGQTLQAGVYSFATSAQLTGTLTLQGDASSVFVIQIGSTLTTASSSKIVLSGAVNPANVFFVVGSSATLGTDTDFKGQILALTSISLDTSASIDCGAAWARNGAVTLDTNTINICSFTVAPGGIATDLGDTGTPTENGIATALDTAATGGGLPLGFSVLSLLTPTELATALTQLGGETAAAAGSATTDNMSSFLNVVLNGDHGTGVVSTTGSGMAPSDDTAPGQNTVSVMGYTTGPGSAVANSAFGTFNHPVSTLPPDTRASLWFTGFGDRSHVAGDPVQGTHDLSVQDFGIAAGFDYRLAPGGRVGVAIGGGGSNFGLSDSLGGGRVASIDVAAYAHQSFGEMYVASVLGYSYGTASTSRTLTFAGFDTLTSQFNVQDVAAQIEAGYHVGLFTPYIALRGQGVRTPGYSESTAVGNSTFALAYAGRTAGTARTEVGVKFDWTTELEQVTFGLHASVAWAHDYWYGDDLMASFVNVPDASFTVAGARADADSVLVSAGADMAYSTGLTLAAAVNGGIARNAQTYGATARVGYSW